MKRCFVCDEVRANKKKGFIVWHARARAFQYEFRSRFFFVACDAKYINVRFIFGFVRERAARGFLSFIDAATQSRFVYVRNNDRTHSLICACMCDIVKYCDLSTYPTLTYT